MWTLVAGSTEKTLSQWKISELQLLFQAGESDQISFSQNADYDADTDFGYGASVVLKNGSDIWFTGTIITPTRSGTVGPKSANAGALRYTAAGPFDDLKKIIFEQNWKKQSGEASASVVILGRDIDNAAISTGAVLKEILDFSIANGANLTYVQADLDALSIAFPDTTRTDITCAEAISAALAWYKDVSVWFDYSSTVPVIRFTPRATASAATIALNDPSGFVTDFEISERADLLAAGVVIRYTRQNAVDGQMWTDISTDSAGSTTGKNVIKMTLRLDGLNITTETCEVKLADAPSTNSEITDWLLDRNPWLANTEISAIEWSDQDVASDHGYILTDGNIPDWSMAETERAQISATAKITYTDGTVEKTMVSDEQTFVSTGQQKYSRIVSGTSGESAPTGVASAVYSQLSVMQYEGFVSLKTSEISKNYLVGKVLNFTGARTEWQTCKAVIQSVTLTPSAGAGIATTTINFGPPEHLTAQDFVEMNRANRQRHQTSLSYERSNATASSEIKPNGPIASSNTVSGRKSFEALGIYNGTKSIVLNPADPDFSEGKVLKVADGGLTTEWVDAGSGNVNESTATPFQSGKLVIASATAHELLGTLIGINLNGGAYAGYGDSDVSTDARVAAIHDSRFAALSGIYGLGAIGGVAVFADDREIQSTSMTSILHSQYGTPSIPCIFGFTTELGTGWHTIATMLGTLSGIGYSKKLTTDSSGNIVWATDGDGVPSGTGQYKVLQLNASNQPAWDYVRAY